MSDKPSTRLSSAQRIAWGAVLTALALMLSWVESLFPLQLWIPLPGIRLGLANLVLLVALYSVYPTLSLWVMVGRCVLQSLLFGTVVSFAYSVSGGLLALGVMALLSRKRGRWFSIYGISIAGAACHHIGQLTCAAFLLHSTAIYSYLPVLLLASIILGSITGIIANSIVSFFQTKATTFPLFPTKER